MASVRPDTASRVAHLPGVKRAVHVVGRGIEDRARARLAEHHDSGASRIEGHREDTDYVVELVDDGPDGDAVAIEAGRHAYVREDGQVVGGMDPLNILRGALP